MDLKRDLVKYVRDKAKSKYEKGTECYICRTQENLEFHHYYSLTELLEKWMKEKGLSKHMSVEDIEIERLIFIKEHKKELYEDTVTLCHYHHQDRLHKLYGKRPPLATAEKQKRWVERQREKHEEK